MEYSLAVDFDAYAKADAVFLFQIYPLVSLREVVSLWEVMRLRRVTAA